MSGAPTVWIDLDEYMCGRVDPIDGACATWYVVDEGIVFTRRATYRENAKSGWLIEMMMPHSGRWVASHRTDEIGWGGLRTELRRKAESSWYFSRMVALTVARDQAEQRVTELLERLSVWEGRLRRLEADIERCTGI